MCGFKKIFHDYKTDEHYLNKLSSTAVAYFISKNECNRNKNNKDFTLCTSDACYSKYNALLQCISTCRNCHKELDYLEECIEKNSFVL